MRKNRFITALATLVLVVSALGVPGSAQDLSEIQPLTAPAAIVYGDMVDESATLWFVELSSAPSVDGTSSRNLKQEQDRFRAAAKKAGVEYTERAAFSTLFNGFSVQADRAQVGALARIAGVTAIWPVVSMSIPTTVEASNPDLATALAMTGADVAQSELGYTGQGIKVAVMDTGVDYHHPDLGGCFGPGCRVVTGYDLVGDAFNADPTSPSYNPNPVPDSDPDDCNGHGTHVAGIVGANGLVTGVAPNVTFGAYRVFGCGGSTTADIMIQAMEMALADGMDILNMSIGSAFQWSQYPTAVAASRLVNKGMVVVASIGNSGASGLYSAGSPGLGDKVIGVASFENTNIALSQFTVSPDDHPIGYAPATGSPAAPTSGSAAMTRTGNGTTLDDGCSALPPGSLVGKVALVRRGTCAFHIKALNAQNAGANGVVLYNHLAGRISPTVAGTPAITIPVVAISDTEGQLINSRLAAGPVTMTWTTTTGTFVNPLGGTISSFSSYGLSPDLQLKPDIAAPGGLIYSTYPLESGGYATISGTSMSSPHVAGTVALLLEARPLTPAQAVRSILQNTAQPKNWWGNPGAGYLDNVHRQGAGMVQIDKAILATTRVEPGKISLGESEAGPVTTTLRVENNGSSSITYALSFTNALSTGSNTFTPGFFLGGASAAFSASTVTVSAGDAASVDVTITPPTGPNRGQYGGYIVLSGDDGSTYRVPYAGFIGDYQAMPVLNIGTYLLNGNAGSQTSFTMANGDLPYVWVHLNHQIRRLRMEVKDAVTGQSRHRAMDLEYVGRNSTPTGYFALAWDGVTVAGKKEYVVPNGQYAIELQVLKALGDENNPAHWETWTSPAFTINRP